MKQQSRTLNDLVCQPINGEWYCNYDKAIEDVRKMLKRRIEELINMQKDCPYNNHYNDGVIKELKRFIDEGK